MDDNAPLKISTSALAKNLQLSSQQMFATLKDYGWIRKLDEGWALTNKGEFEGGEYVHSKKYGRYIVWPQELLEHPLFQAMEDNRHLSATALGKKVGLGAREVNRGLAELGWIKHGFQGWELNFLGEQYGGIQLENENSGTFYIVWPQAIEDNSLLNQQLKHSAAIYSTDSLSEGDDLFAPQSDYPALDGHIHQSKAHQQICHWLYMAGVAHACKRRLPIDKTLYADFYIPAHQLYIECWDDGESSGLSQRMQRKEFYAAAGFTVIDIEKEDLKQIDELLTRKFRKLGIRVY